MACRKHCVGVHLIGLTTISVGRIRFAGGGRSWSAEG